MNRSLRSVFRRSIWKLSLLAIVVIAGLFLSMGGKTVAAADASLPVGASTASAALPERCLTSVYYSVNGGNSWLRAKWTPEGTGADQPSTVNSAHYGHGGEGFWHIEVPACLLSQPGASDNARRYFEVLFQHTYDFQWSVAGGSASGPCVTGLRADTSDFEDGGGPVYRLSAHEKPRNIGASAIWTHQEPDCFTGGADTEVRAAGDDWIMKLGALGVWEGARQVHGVQLCGDKSKKWTDIGEQFVGGVDSVIPFYDIHQGAGQRKPEINGAEPVDGRVTQSLRFRYSLPTGERRFGFYGTEAAPKSWYAFSIALERKDRRGSFRKDGWPEPLRHANLVISHADSYQFRPDTIGLLIDQELGLVKLAGDIASATAADIYSDLAMLTEFVLVETWHRALSNLGLPHPLNLNSNPNSHVLVTDPSGNLPQGLIEACAHDPGSDRPAELRVGKPSRIWVEMFAPDGGAQLEAVSSSLLMPHERADWIGTRHGLVQLRNSLITKAVFATVFGETLRNSLAVLSTQGNWLP